MNQPFQKLSQEVNILKEKIKEAKGLEWWNLSKLLCDKYQEFDKFTFNELSQHECNQLLDQDKQLRNLLQERVEWILKPENQKIVNTPQPEPKKKPPVALIVLQVTSCQQCPNFGTRNPWSSDGWDRMIDWYCRLTNGTIQGAVEWHEEDKIPVPTWCPIHFENQKA